ncbi:MAG: 3'-5' exonuclease [Desulfovibrionaceae bacterium]|nr:3'-5' exonuclease [Desulfovibrionaceae bacterium]
MYFIAIDVETANYNLHSICQIGLVEYKLGKITPLWESLLNPYERFNCFNTEVHGISQEMVEPAPSFPEIYPKLHDYLAGNLVISHTKFDKGAINAASARYGLPEINCTWLDSSLIAKRAWPQFARGGFGLANLSRFLDFEFRHHDALEDARACACIVAKAIEQTGICANDWLLRVKDPVSKFRKPAARARPPAP